MTRTLRPLSILFFLGAAALPAVALSAPAGAVAPAGQVVVAAGQTWVVPATTRLRALTVEPGGIIAAPDGYSVTLTVNGVETGGALTRTGGTDTRIAAGTYRGDVVLTVARANPVAWQGLTFPFRQALYVDGTGVVGAKSVPAAVSGGQVGTDGARDLRIRSTGEAFNGVYVNGGSYTLRRPDITLTGNGRSDFVGYGAALVGTGSGARLVVDGAHIDNRGAVRTAVVADGGANVVVKNSQISTSNGVLPADYQATVDTAYMESVPWMLSLSGDARATNLLGTDTKASYINSCVSSEGWGVLSTDSGQDGQLTAIDSRVAITGRDGYGSYAIGNATERFLGTRFDVATYANINRGGTVYFGDSTRSAVAQLNSDLGLGLSAPELAALPERPTVVNSRRFGVMWHGAGATDISGGTVFNTREATFLDKGQQVAIAVDGSRGARLNPADGVLMQVMENDDPGPQMVNGVLLNTGVYTEPTGDPTKLGTFDVTAAHSTDAVATFSHIALRGDFYNAIRGGVTGGGGPGGGGLAGLNMVLTFDHASITGVISATAAHHAVDTITSANYEQLGEVTNAVHAVVNNGVLVTLTDGAQWTVTGTSYLSRLALSAGAAVRAPAGHRVAMTVDGVPTPLVPGTTYSGAIVLTVR